MNRRKNITRGLLLLALLCVATFFQPLGSVVKVSAGDGSSNISTETREGRLAVFDDVWETIDERYYDPFFGGLDWNAVKPVYRQEAANARSGQDLYLVLRRMVGSLNDPHTRVYSPSEKFDWWRPRFITAGFSLREIEGFPTVVHVDQKSAAAQAGIRPGDIIETIDSVPISSLIKQKLTHESVSNSLISTRLRAVASVMEGEPGSTVSVKWRNRGGKAKTEKLTRFWDQRIPTFQVREDGTYLYVEVQTFTQVLAFEVLRALKDKMKNTRGIVLDLRNNGGGDADAMAAIAAVFLGDGFGLGRFTDRGGLSFELSTYSKLVLTADRFETQLPLIVLVSDRTSSAAEILAAALQAQGRAKVVGTETCGCVLAIRSRHNLPDEGVLDVSELDYKTRDGVRLERQGVRPDYFLVPQRQDFYAQRDRVKDFALNLLKKQMTTQP
jgi:carboxyl-terminal processing protease